jgi:hypothetical protein
MSAKKLQVNTCLPNPFMKNGITVREFDLLNNNPELKKDWLNRGKDMNWLRDYVMSYNLLEKEKE